MSNTAFLSAYKKLNPAQKRAVLAIEGPVAVIAGPGTGKTRVLVLRIANILHKTDTRPENILALTFTESGVYSMRKNLSAIIGSAAYRVRIETFHGFCNEVIKRYPEEFPNIIGGTNITRATQIRILEDVLKVARLKTLKPSGDMFYYLYPALSKITELKRDGIPPRDFEKIIRTEESNNAKNKETTKANIIKKTRAIQKAKELLIIYKKYQEALIRERFYDYDDMIMEVLKKLEKSKELVLLVGEEYQYILADEHQDANRAQNKVLELLCQFHSPYPNLFIVGDEKQAIFRFQGASLENLYHFQKLYPKALIITLSTNYRGTQTLLDAAGSLIRRGNLKDPKGATLSAHRKEVGKKIFLYAFQNENLERLFIARDIRKKIEKENILPSDIAVLYRDNRDAFPIALLLEKEGIPFRIESDENILDDDDMRKLLLLFRTVDSFGDDALLVQVLHTDFLKLSHLDIHLLVLQARTERKSLYALISKKELLLKAGLSEPEAFFDLYQKLKRWKTLATNTSFVRFLDHILEESGYIAYALRNSRAWEKTDALSRVYREAENESHEELFYLKDFLAHLLRVERYNIPVGREKGADFLEGVHLLTAHRAKGLEFPYVYIVHARDKHWGNRRIANHFSLGVSGSAEDDELFDERRLFYVALTRARKGVCITYAENNERGGHTLPSPFILEIDPRYIESVDTHPIERALQEKREGRRHVRSKNITATPEKEFYVKRFIEQGLNVTALNNYLECPWKYFYRNLVRIPYAQTSSQIFGSAMHAALKYLFDEKDGKKNVGKNELFRALRRNLDRFSLEKDEHDRLYARGKKALSYYYMKYGRAERGRALNEFSVEGVLFNGVPLSGILDRVEFLTTGHTRVYDYKTGKRRSRNEMLGTTKGKSGGYFRQLVFYKFLLESYDKKRFTVEDGVIDFVEPDEKGRLAREVFSVKDDDVLDLKKVLEKVIEEIKGLSFWDKTCENKECEYCRLRNTSFGLKSV